MKIESLIRTLVAPLVLVASLAVVPSAFAGSLLSGYGGPGQGNQAIIGSALLNGPSGGGGSGSGGSGGGGVSEAAGTTASGAAERAVSGSSSAPGHPASSRVHHKGASSGKPSSNPAALATPPALRISSATESSPPLGLSGRDIFYAVLALLMLAATAALTLRVARGEPTTATKGMPRSTRVTD